MFKKKKENKVVIIDLGQCKCEEKINAHLKLNDNFSGK